MKKLWIISAVVCFLAGTSTAQESNSASGAYAIEMNHNKLSGSSVDPAHAGAAEAKTNALTDLELKNFNYQSRAAFYADFGYIPITGWETAGEFDKINFMQNGVNYTAYYDYDAKLVGTTSNVSVADLPAHALDNINKKYKGYTVGDIVFFEDNELNETVMIYYERRFDDEDKYFVELKNDKEKIAVQVNDEGNVSFFATLK